MFSLKYSYILHYDRNLKIINKNNQKNYKNLKIFT